MKFTLEQSADIKRRWKVVRRDNFTDVPGLIECADEETGECTLVVAAKDGTTSSSNYSFGPNMIRIIGRR